MTITGSEWARQIESLTRSEIMASVIDQVQQGSYIQWPWVNVTIGEITLSVMSDVFAIGTENNLIRVPLDAPTARTVADITGHMLPTSQISDIIWLQAAYRLAPRPMGPPDFPYDSSMMSVYRFELHSHWIDQQLRTANGHPEGLVAGHKKDVVLSNHLLEHPGRVAIYGWHRLDGNPIQGPEVSIAHEDTYYDYSHGIRLIHQTAKVKGASVSLKELLADPARSQMLSREGPITPDLISPDPVGPVILPPTISRYRGNDPKTVKRWQRIIHTDRDGIFGPLTELSTKVWQQDQQLQVDGIVGPMTWRKALGIDPLIAEPDPAKESIAFVRAKYYRPITGIPRQIDYLVIHTMEAVEHPQTGENVAYWSSRGCPDADGKERRASWHYAIDEDSIVQCVLEKDVAFCAPGTNHNGIHLEHAGYSAQTDAQWQDAYSQGMLARSARLAAQICTRHRIPVIFIDWKGLLAGKRGITYHREVSKACRYAQDNRLTNSPFFNSHSSRPKTDHGDPGLHLPIDQYLQMIKDHRATTS
jgi:peptidoglycan hydrolase-like protein with peptidoglycan-binding domain